METIMTTPRVVVKVEKEEEEDGFSEGTGSEGAQDGTGDDGSETEDIKDTKEEANPNAGWAEAMAKILGKKTSESKPTILVRNKKLEKIQAEEKKERLEKKKQVDKKRTWENMFRQKPDVVSDREHEKNLQRAATRGVVQLFNAVKKHQKDVSDRVKTAGGSDRKKAKILSSITKRDFIDVLRGVDTPQAKTEETVEVKEEAASWSVLKDDFMMGATMKDWDQESHDSHEGHADYPRDCDGICSSDESE